MIRNFLLTLALIVSFDCLAMSRCSEILKMDHAKVFAHIEEQAKGVATFKALKELADKWVELGVRNREEALACRQSGEENNRQKFWNISYSYRVLSDTLRALDIDSSENQLEVFRKQFIERIDYAKENLRLE